MKNLKKALALTIASVAVFGTIASADFLNPITDSWSMSSLYQTTITSSFGMGVSAPATAKESIYDSATEQISSKVLDTNMEITYDSDNKVMQFKAGKEVDGEWKQALLRVCGVINGNVNLYQPPYFNFYVNGNGATSGGDQRHSAWGKIKSTATFSFDSYAVDADGNSDIVNTQILNAGHISMGISYKKPGETSAKLETGASLNLGTMNSGKLEYSENNITMSLMGKTATKPLSGYVMGDKLSLILEADCVNDTATLVLYNHTQNKEMSKLEVTKDDGIDIVCVKTGFWGRFAPAWNMSWYEMSSVREQFVAKDAKVEKSGNTVTGTISVANNAETNVGAAIKDPSSDKGPSATVIMALYDANGKMIDCGTSVVNELEKRQGNEGSTDADRIQNPPKFVNITASAEASDYAYAKFFVWDGANTMNPFTEAAKVDAN